MSLSGISFWELLLILIVVVLVFGTSKLKTIGGDIGSAIHNFRNALSGGEKANDEPPTSATASTSTAHKEPPARVE